jgi:hypothetical protein
MPEEAKDQHRHREAEIPMAQLQWVDFIRKYQAGHLVTAVVEPARSSQHLLRLRRLLSGMISEGKPSSDFATAIVRVTGVVQIHCGFAEKRDADVLAGLTKARSALRPAGWASHRSFKLSADREVALAGLLTPPNKRGAD